MNTPTLADLPHVLDPAVVSGLAERLVTVANATQTSMTTVHDRWNVLGDTEVFHVTGAEGVPRMLDRPRDDAQSFAESLIAARNALYEAASSELPDLRSRREELASRIGTVVADYTSAEEAKAMADSTYWSTRSSGTDPDVAADAALGRSSAGTTLRKAQDALDTLRDDIDRLRRDIEDSEDRLASRLRGVSGGTEVYAAGGEPLRVSHTFWGFVENAYPGAPAAASTSRTLAEQLTYELARAAERRIDWLATADEDSVKRWMDAHPDFVQAVAFVDPHRAGDLFADLASTSTAASNGEWNAGPLAQLLALAPLVVGNLNGIPAPQRGMFNRSGLAQALARDDLDDETRTRLEQLRAVIEQRGADGTRPTLLSFFLDTEGSPRANIAFGDVDDADQITTLTHGIRTDLGSLNEWARGSADLQSALTSELERTGQDKKTAVVLVMDWDSGGVLSVREIDRPDAGASRLSQTWQGLHTVNPDAQLNAGAHSLGTTMTGQALSDNPGLVSHVWFFGSAGVTPQTGDELAAQIRSGQTELFSTHADDDNIAEWGRKDWLGSAHAVDPRDIPGVERFGSNGGVVPGYGSPRGEYGESTDSHDAHNSVKDEIVGWTVGPDGSPMPIIEETEKFGYLDPSAESFKHFVVGLRDALNSTGAP
jgi:hypothetical protein